MEDNDSVHVAELIPAFVLQTLANAERREVLRHLATCHLCLRELADYQAVSDQLGVAVRQAEPAAALKQRLLARIQAGPGPQVAAPPVPWWGRPLQAVQTLLSGPVWRPLSLALILLLLFSNVVLWAMLSQRPEPASWQQEAIPLTSTSEAAGAHALLLIGHDGLHATLVVKQLPVLDEDRQYQLWLIEDGTRTSGAVFSVHADGNNAVTVTAPQSLWSYSDFGVTIEPAGGSPGPTGAKVLGHDL